MAGAVLSWLLYLTTEGPQKPRSQGGRNLCTKAWEKTDTRSQSVFHLASTEPS